MHPILFRIPLPKMPLKLWWALAAVAAIAAVYALIGLRKKDRASAGTSILVVAGAAIAAYAMRDTKFEAANLPIYSYGVMLGLSLVVGWYLTLKLAERSGLPKETMANCYVITAIAAIFGSRVLYVVTNLDEFKVWTDFFALRRGGLVAYGGFIGGYLGSWIYLQRHRIRLLPWADMAVPSLASGLLITRIGCYLFGCDFGKRLPEGAPAFLKKLGTFPKWTNGTLDGGLGSPAYVKHLETFRGTPLGTQIENSNGSLPVHPTQLYEALVGLFLLVILLLQRRNQRFRGQIFFLFAFGYGYLRFLLEIIRDDSERGEFGPMLPEHLFISGVLLVLGGAFAYGISLGITNPRARLAARVAAFVPPIVAYVMLRPQSFGRQIDIQLSTSQWIGFLSAVACAIFYAYYWEQARRTPKLAMSLESLGDIKPTGDDLFPKKRSLDDDDEDELPKKKKKKKRALREPGASEERTPLPLTAGDGLTEEDAEEEASGEDAADESTDEKSAETVGKATPKKEDSDTL